MLVEKAKTTPDAYPLTINGLINGCNQKSNRSPLMSLSQEDIEQALSELREMGAVVEVQSSGRVPKFRHQLYEWLGVDKVELAVMAELLLRGEQTVGELRTHASRMEPIADLTALRTILRSLVAKKLVLELTPEGRGQLITHRLHTERELAEVQTRAAEQSSRTGAEDSDAPAGAGTSARGRVHEELEAVRADLAELREEVQRLRDLIEKPA